ncbi:MAG: hypothetical protein NVSMB42_05480 [Herpetosiphon sp.]
MGRNTTVDALAKDLHVTGRGADQTHYRAQQGRLAGAARSDQTNKLAGHDTKRGILKDGFIIVAAGYLVKAN